MAYFLCRLNAPRPSFAFDMTDEERALMGAHAGYWSSHLAEGRVVVFGLVAEPDAPWGVSVVRAEDEAAVRALTDADPVIQQGEGFRYDVFAMPNAVTREEQEG